MKNTLPSTTNLTSQREALEARVALRLAGRLSESAQHLPHDITERLRVARDRAVEHARQVRHAVAAAPAAVVVGRAGGAAVFGATPVWLRLASLMPLIVLIVGLVLIQQYHDYEQIAVAAEIDAALLSDELPPTAYGDPGFAEYLRSATP
ncbi:DUF3619 family protein [Aquincola sp. S2]|uniref:DUF3619 family protein n=1 Tax=Pseudaquabacterium terrae TaxID=2732868 RepID=A0ABX2EJ96_9BURK|nr:DUF3619 family protein [Aquabacterium terrae]NRF68647.1 DUF3619 family protein [Aquabacterium terrae]